MADFSRDDVEAAFQHYKVVNRADNPEPGGAPVEFPSLQVIHTQATASGLRKKTGGS
jgi:hypothetical protein